MYLLCVYYFCLFLIPFLMYTIFKKSDTTYNKRGWFYLPKFYYALKAVKNYQKECQSRKFGALDDYLENEVRFISDKHTNTHSIYGIDKRKNSISLNYSLRANKYAEVSICLRAEGHVYICPGHQNVRIVSVPNERQWKSKNLHLEISEPYRYLRITFNGILKNVKTGALEHVQFNFVWSCTSSPKFFPHDTNPSMLTDSIVAEKWRDGDWISLLTNLSSSFEQFGAFRGIIKGDAFPEEKTYNLPGLRSKYAEEDIRYTLNRKLKIFIAVETGALINIEIRSYRNGCSQINSGSVIGSHGIVESIESLDIDLESIAPYKNLPKLISFHVKVSKTVYKCILHLHLDESVKLGNEEIYGSECISIQSDCDVNCDQGKAVVEFWYSANGNSTHLPPELLSSKKVSDIPDDLIVDISSENAKILELTGGKGNSLALLSSLDTKEFIVPDGFVITVNTFQTFLNANKSVKDALLKLQEICYGNSAGSLEETCAKTVTMIKQTKMTEEIEQAILHHLEKINKNEQANGPISWAVRSSAIGEDSDELSAAGQNETFLGCSTDESVLKAVTACWASLFTFQSVQYRWQHGLPILSDMAVVVQRMVPADKAGVLFTCHPTTSHPLQLVITANYGLGESVVSGKTDPDTFIIQRDYHTNDLSIVNCAIGTKNTVIKMSQDGVTEQETNNLNEKSCISELEALKIAKVGVYLENIFGNARDIEWAIYGEQLYLLQSRPITTTNIWTDFELLHEMDTPILTEDWIFTVANTGEVLPGAVSALSHTTVIKTLHAGAMQTIARFYDPYADRMLPVINKRTMLNCINAIYRFVDDEIGIESHVLDLAIFGHSVINDKIHQTALKCNAGAGKKKLANIVNSLKVAYKTSKIFNQIQEKSKRFQIDIKDSDTLEQSVEKIEEKFDEFIEMHLLHSDASHTSVLYQTLAMILLCGKSKELTLDHCSDFAQIVSSCENVVSAEVPAALEEMAFILQRQEVSDGFMKIDPLSGVQWLKENSTETSEKFDKFLEKHGHRVLGEFELCEKPWEMEPEKVISMLQAVCKSPVKVREKSAVNTDIVDKLVCPKSKVTKAILRYLLPKIQRAVACREATKSELIRTTHKYRLAYRKLASKMVSQGILPSTELIFHLTHHELRLLIAKSNPLLINKAVRRQKLHPKWSAFKFPELMYGIPKPEVEEDIIPTVNGEIVCTGTPVCDGTIKARACVIQHLSEINQLESGDVLITYSTDIGWSPYFPIIAGVVTELGGLISHGAVVAREYGLPCLVGARGATRMFKTGDIVFLSGKTGTISLTE